MCVCVCVYAVHSACRVEPYKINVTYNQWLILEYRASCHWEILEVDLYAPGNPQRINWTNKPIIVDYTLGQCDNGDQMRVAATIQLNMTTDMDSDLNGVITVMGHLQDESCTVCTALPAVQYSIQNNVEPWTTVATPSKFG